MRAVAVRLGISPAQVGLAWQLAHSPNTMIIAGTSGVEHLMENTSAARVQLDRDAMTALGAARLSPQKK